MVCIVAAMAEPATSHENAASSWSTDAGFVTISWDEALDATVTAIKTIQQKYGKDAFAMLSGVSLTNEKGTGLGLPIARSLIELHGGQLSITSVKGVGTEVNIEFPPASEVTLFEGRHIALAKA